MFLAINMGLVRRNVAFWYLYRWSSNGPLCIAVAFEIAEMSLLGTVFKLHKGEPSFQAGRLKELTYERLGLPLCAVFRTVNMALAWWRFNVVRRP